MIHHRVIGKDEALHGCHADDAAVGLDHHGVTVGEAAMRVRELERESLACCCLLMRLVGDLLTVLGGVAAEGGDRFFPLVRVDGPDQAVGVVVHGRDCVAQPG